MKQRISKILNIIMGSGIIFFTINQLRKSKADNKGNGNDKMAVYYNIMNKWMKLREDNKSISDYLEQHGYDTIAIYGLGDIGKHLQKELENSKIKVEYAIDRSFYATINLDVYLPESELPPVDAVIVTPVMDYDVICKDLKEKISCPVLSIANIINTY